MADDDDGGVPDAWDPDERESPTGASHRRHEETDTGMEPPERDTVGAPVDQDSTNPQTSGDPDTTDDDERDRREPPGY